MHEGQAGVHEGGDEEEYEEEEEEDGTASMVMENNARQPSEILGGMCTREEALRLLQQSSGNTDIAAAMWFSVHSQACAEPPTAPKKQPLLSQFLSPQPAQAQELQSTIALEAHLASALSRNTQQILTLRARNTDAPERFRGLYGGWRAV